MGNWVGEFTRLKITGEREFNFSLSRNINDRFTQTSLYPVSTNYFPAILFAFLGRPSWLWAFIGGFFMSALIGDRYELRWLEMITQKMVPGGGEEEN
jgi:hypothetical protein